MAHIRTPKSPNLVLPEKDYKVNNEDQFRNQLRLYFNQLDDANQTLYGPVGGYHLDFPHIAAYNATDQYALGDDTPTQVLFTVASDISGFTLNADNTATPQYDGTYKVEYRLQALNSDNAIHDIVVWMKIDGVDLEHSASKFSKPARKSVGVPSYGVSTGFITWEATAGSKVALYWATEKAAVSGGADGVYLHHEVAQASPYAHPEIPSAYGVIQYIGRE